MTRSGLILFNYSVLPRTVLRRSFNVRWSCNVTRTSSPSQQLRARQRRQEATKARNAAHLELKRLIDARRQSDAEIATVYISIPRFVRERCGLTNKLARVKTVMEKSQLDDELFVRNNTRNVLINLFPELEKLIINNHHFELNTVGTDVENIFLEIVPHNLPPPVKKKIRSERYLRVQNKLRDSRDGDLSMVSFYKFYHVEDPDALVKLLKKLFSSMNILGRIYVAKEGINAQISVPSVIYPDFVDVMSGKWTSDYTIPRQLVGIYLNEDGEIPAKELPFHSLHIRHREKVLADGLSEVLDWNGNNGREIEPEEWDAKMKDGILIDCRNKYETDMGTFKGAELPNTKTFKETWSFLEERLKGVDRNTPINTFCTGGIRCVKVNTYLTQKLGFNNAARLKGGIVSYARKLEEKNKLEESQFIGVNHVFDGRVGKSITSDVLSRCLNCGISTEIQTDCAYVGCKRSFDDRLFVQCPDCAAQLKGCCSTKCMEAISISSPPSRRGVLDDKINNNNNNNTGVNEFITPKPSPAVVGDDSIYAEEFSSGENALVRELRLEAESKWPGRAHMLSGPMQAAFLKMLVGISGAKHVLELGTYVGYSTLYMAEALPADGKIITCEIDQDVADVAQNYFQRSPHSHKIHLQVAKAMDVMNNNNEEGTAFDMIYIDANKGMYEEYYERSLEIMKPGGLLVFDNVLFKGLVAKTWISDMSDSSSSDEEVVIDENLFLHSTANDVERKMIRNRQRSIRKAHKIARKLHQFNLRIQADERTEQVLLPARDGLLLVRKMQRS